MDDNQEKIEGLVSSALDAKAYDPNKYSKAMSDAERFMLPAETVYNNEEELSLQNNNFAEIVKSNSSTARFLTNTDNARASSDKIADLKTIEDSMGKYARRGDTLWDDVVQNFEDFNTAYGQQDERKKYSEIKTNEVLDTLLGTSLVNPQDKAWADSQEFADVSELGTGGQASKFLIGSGDFIGQMEQTLISGGKGMVVVGGASALGGAIIGGIGGALGGPAGAVAGAIAGAKAGWTVGGRFGLKIGASDYMFKMETASAWDEYKNIKDENGNLINQKAAALASVAYGLASSGVEYGALTKALSLTGKALDIGPLKAIGETIKKEGIKKALRDPATVSTLIKVAEKIGLGLGITAIEVGEEGVQSALQTGIKDVLQQTQDIDFKKQQGLFAPITTEEYTKSIGSSMVGAFYSTGLLSVGVGGFGGYKAYRKSQAPKSFEDTQQEIQGINQKVKESGLAERPTVLGRFAQELDNGRQFFVPEKFLSDFMAKLSPESSQVLEKAIPDIHERIADANASGAEVTLSTPEYITGIATLEEADSLAPFIKNDPTDFTQSDMEEFGSFVKDNSEAIQQAAKLMRSDMADDETVSYVSNQIKNIAQQAGRTPKEAEGVGKMFAMVLSNTAKITGQSAQEIFNRQMLAMRTVTEQGEGVSGGSNYDNLLGDIKKLEAGKRIGKEKKAAAEAFKARLIAAGVKPEQIGTITGEEVRNALGGSEQSNALFQSEDAYNKERGRLVGQYEDLWKELESEVEEGTQLSEGQRKALKSKIKLVEKRIKKLEAEKKSGKLYQATVETQTQEFKNWFGNSKVVDESGKPIIVYHGTNQNIDRFKKSKLGKNTGSVSSKAFFFTTDPIEADEYANMAARKLVSNADEWEKTERMLSKKIATAERNRDFDEAERLYEEYEKLGQEAISGEERGANIIPAFLRIENPLVLDMEGSVDLYKIEEAIKKAKKLGHDGIRLDNVFDAVAERPELFYTTQYIAFEPNQIKSIFNRGTFDINDSRILYQQERGSIEYDAMNNILISLTKNANFSTTIHEMSHWVVLLHGDLYKRMNDNPEIIKDAVAAAQFKKDYEGLLEFVGSADGTLNREQHEQIAAAFEAFMREGKAPSKALRGIFMRFAEWLSHIYSSHSKIKGYKGINDEVRGIFGRWLATTSEIEQVQAVNESLNIVSEVFGDTALSEKVRNYIQAAHDEAIEGVYRRLERQQSRLETDAYKEAFEVEKKMAIARLEREPVYGLLKYLADNESKIYVGAYEQRGPIEDGVFNESEPMSAEDFARLQAEIAQGFEITQNREDVIKELLKKKPVQPPTILSWIRSKGGIKDVGGDLKSMGVPKGVINNKSGITPDYMREAAVEEGFIAAKGSNDVNVTNESTIQDLLGAIDQELCGTPVYRDSDNEFVAAYQQWENLNEIADQLGITQLDIDQARAESVKYGSKADVFTTQADAPNAVGADVIAGMFGFKSGAYLIQQIRKTPNISYAASKQAREVLKSVYGDMVQNGKIRAVARAELYNGETLAALDILAAEAGKRAGVKTDNLRTFAKALANNMLQRATVGSLAKAKKFDVAREKAQRDALVAAKKGDWQGAVVALQKAMINHEMFHMAAEFAHKMETFDRVVDRLNRKDNKLPKSWHPDYIYAARAILSNYGKTRTGRDIQAWIADLAENDPETLYQLEALGDISRFKPKAFKDLTYAEFQDLKQVIDNLIYVGRKNKEIETAEGKISIEKANEELVEAMRLKNEKGVAAPAMGSDITWWQNAKAQWKKFCAQNWRIEAFARWVDNENVEGAFTRLIVRPVMDAALKSEDHRKEAMVKLYNTIIKNAEKKYQGKKIIAPELVSKNFNGEFRDKWALICAALNAGSMSNLKPLLGGYNWTYENLMKVFEQNFTQEDMDFVQSVWDFLETDIKPYVMKEYRARTGLMLETVDPMSFTFKGKEYKGGYYPLEADRTPMRGADIGLEGMDNEIFGDKKSRPIYPAPNRGATKERTGAIYPVSLNLATLYKHVDDTIHSWAVGETLYGVHRMVNLKQQVATTTGKTTRGALIDEIGKQNSYWADIINPWLRAVAKNSLADQVDNSSISRAVGILRRHATVAYVGWNLLTAAQGSVNIVTHVPDEISNSSWDGKKEHLGGGTRYTTAGVFEYSSSPNETRQFIEERSVEMRNRFMKSDMLARRSIKNISEGGGAYAKSNAFLRDHAFILDNLIDQMVSSAAWIGAYRKATDQGATDIQAVAYADRVVRTSVMASDVKDSSQIQRGHIVVRLLTIFSNYTNMKWNRLAVRTRQVSSGDISVPAFIGSMTMNMVMPAVLTALVVAALGGAPDDEDDFMSWMAARAVGDLFGVFPVGRDLAPYAFYKITGVGYGQGMTNPIYGVAERFGNSVTDIGSAMYDIAQGDDVNWSKATRAAATAYGMLANVPVVTPARILSTIIDWWEGDSEPESPADAVQKLIGGTRK